MRHICHHRPQILAHRLCVAAVAVASLPSSLFTQHLDVPVHRLCLSFFAVCRLVSIHNNPENLKVPKGFQQLKMTVADVHTQDITPYFNPSYDLIEEARNSNEGDACYSRCQPACHYPHAQCRSL